MSVRIVAARHDACGNSTRVRLPSSVPARAVHRLRCDHCERAFEIGEVDDFGLESELSGLEAALAKRKKTAFKLPAVKLPKLAKTKLTKPKLTKPTAVKLPKIGSIDPESRTVRLATISVAAVLVIGGLVLLQGGDEPAAPVAGDNSPPSVVAGDDISSIPPATAGDQTGAPTTPTTTPTQAVAPPAAESGGGDANLVSGTTYSLALPQGWEQIEPPSGATFAAADPNGEADATLWVTRDPNLDFPTFVQQSLAQLRALAGSADIVERVPAPTEEATIVKLAAEAPPGQPSYEVILRVNGEYRYYLSTTVQSDAAPEVVQAADLIEGSFTPEAKG